MHKANSQKTYLRKLHSADDRSDRQSPLNFGWEWTMIDSKSSKVDGFDRRSILIAATAMVATAAAVSSSNEANAQTPATPLASWNDGPAKQAILDFVRATTSGTTLVPPEDRIATFDQDGTLWVEHPLYSQAFFALYRVHEMAPQHPEWKDAEPFKSVIAGDREALAKFTERDWFEIIGATHSGMSTDEFPGLVRPWLEAAKDPRFKRSFTDLVYQ